MGKIKCKDYCVGAQLTNTSKKSMQPSTRTPPPVNKWWRKLDGTSAKSCSSFKSRGNQPLYYYHGGCNSNHILPIHRSTPPLTMCQGVIIELAKECRWQRGPWVPGYKAVAPYHHPIMEITARYIQSTQEPPYALVILFHDIISQHQPWIRSPVTPSLIYLTYWLRACKPSQNSFHYIH